MKDYIYFGSSCKEPYYKLSNLYLAPISLSIDQVTPSMIEVNENISIWIESMPEKMVIFRSVEHLWHSLKSKDIETFSMFIQNGKLATFDEKSFLPLCATVRIRKGKETSPEIESKRKFEWWNKKNMAGIVPKLAVGNVGRKKFDLTYKLIHSKETLDSDLEQRVWVDMLTLKYSQNKDLGEILKETGDKTLIEFDRSAARVDCRSHWGGIIKDKVLLGENVMGKYLSLVRNSLLFKVMV